MSQDKSSFPIPKFWETSYWEPTVQLAIRDYCRPGDVAFDIGANAGALSQVMSRLVGPKGVVCAFEASPRIVDKTVENLVAAGCFNTQVYLRAVYHTSKELVTLYPGNHLNDSIYSDFADKDAATFQVETLAIDDFVRYTGLTPTFIKMDIEGAEFDALQGARNLLASSRPVLVLEQNPTDRRCYEMLVKLGYSGIDLATYELIKSSKDFCKNGEVANILFIHGEHHPNDPYLSQTPPELVTSLEKSDFEVSVNGSIETKHPVHLTPGRYICVGNFSAHGNDNTIFYGIENSRETIVRYHTYTRFMASSYRQLVFSIKRPENVKLFLRFLQGSDSTFDWQGALVYRLPAFSAGDAFIID